MNQQMMKKLNNNQIVAQLNQKKIIIYKIKFIIIKIIQNQKQLNHLQLMKK